MSTKLGGVSVKGFYLGFYSLACITLYLSHLTRLWCIAAMS